MRVLAGKPTSDAVGTSLRTPRVEVWTVDGASERKLDPAVGIGPSSLQTDPVARQAYTNATKVDRFFRSTFGRDGWDGKGTSLKVVVHTPDESGGPLNNANWVRSQGKIYLGDGDGTIFSPLGGALDVLTHETTHAIVDSEVRLRYSGQQGAVNESWADVMGALADSKNWLIGEDVITPGRPGDAIRDLEHPRYSSTTMLPRGADVEVHDLSGIPSLVAVRVAKAIGRPDMGQIWYHALTDHMGPQSGFSGAARATIDAALDLYGAGSNQLSAVRDAWKSVGVNPRLTKEQRARIEAAPATDARAGAAKTSNARTEGLQLTGLRTT
jgi:Zn-dependent metalloprotease